MNKETESQAPSNTKSPKLLTVLRRLILFIIILAVLIIGSATTIAYRYQNEVKGFIITELNKHLDSEIIVDGKDIDFTVLKKFPYAAVDFRNVKALEVTKNKKKDTLFTAGEISLQFNIIDIFNKKYNIKKIKFEQVNLNIKIDKNGNDNYHFWKAAPKKDSTVFAFALEEIDLQHIHINYKNSKAKQKFSVLINSSTLSGNFSNNNYSLETESNILFHKIRIGNTTYLKNKNVRLKLEMLVDNTNKSYKIKTGDIKIEKLAFDISGDVVHKNKELVMNMDVNGKDIDIKSLLSLIPKGNRKITKDYKSTGEFYFNASINGKLSNKTNPIINAEFGIKNGEITQVKDDITLHHINLKGKYANGVKANNTTSTLLLSPFSVVIKQGSISGELSINNFENPIIDTKIKGDFQLEDLLSFTKINTIENLRGQLIINALFKGKWNEINKNNYKSIRTQGELSVLNMTAKLKNNSLDFKNISGDFSFDNNDLIINKMNGQASSSDFELKGVLKNSIGFLLKENQKVTIDATLNSNNINLNELLANSSDSSSTNSKYKLQFSENLNVNLNSNIKNLVFRRFEAENIKGSIRLKNKKMIADNINLTTMNGNINVSGFVDGRDSTQLALICNSTIDKIDAKKLFYEFENFSQSAITDKNIEGEVSAKIDFTAIFSPELKMDMNTLHATIDMAINNGELNNVESFKSLSRFIALEELSSIHFSTFKNSFEIKDQTLSFPKMELKSSAINLTISGTHTFNNEIDYKVMLSLNELLAKKAKRAKKQNEDFGQITDDGLGRTNIYLLMKGTVNNPIIKYDKKEAIVDIKQEIKKEKKEIKAILKEEFGLFKKDTTIVNTKKEEDTKFEIEWEEEDEVEEENETETITPQPEEEDEDF